MLNLIEFIKKDLIEIDTIEVDYCIIKSKDFIDNNIKNMVIQNYDNLKNYSNNLYNIIKDINNILDKGFLLIYNVNSLCFYKVIENFLLTKKLVKNKYTSFLELYQDIFELKKYFKTNQDVLDELCNICYQYKLKDNNFLLISENYIDKFVTDIIWVLEDYIKHIDLFNNNKKYQLLLKESLKEVELINKKKMDFSFYFSNEKFTN